MPYAYRTDNGWIEVDGSSVDLPEMTVSSAWLATHQDPDEVAARGFALVAEEPRPAGVRVLGSTVEDVDGVPTRVWQAEPYGPEDLAALHAAAVAAVKAEARARILARFPEWKQANMTARGVELSHALHTRTWTAEEQGEVAVLQSDWDWIKAVRAHSDALEAALDPADAAALEAFDAAAADGWPEA
jgi:hypothetical protein